jgi:hypothetical protein
MWEKISKKKYGDKARMENQRKEALPPWPEAKIMVSQFYFFSNSLGII